MQITRKMWNNYAKKMSAIDTKAADLMRAWIEAHGIEDREALLKYANALIMHYGEASASLACEMYDAIAKAEGVTVPSAEPVDIPKFGEVAKAVNGALKQSENVVPSAVARMTKMMGADTTLRNAERDGAQFAWIASGETCKFCLMLAAKGWQYMSKDALKNGHAEHIHGNCDCQYIVRFNKYNNVLKLGEPLEERRRQLILDKNSEIILDRRHVKTYLVTNSRYGVHVSEKAGLKQQGLNNIEKSIDKALKFIGKYDEKMLPQIFILSPEEINSSGRVFALYNCITNELILASTLGNKRDTIIAQHILGFADPQNPNSTTIHELLHWSDAISYRKENHSEITKENLEIYLKHQNQRAIIELNKAEINESNVRNISKYAKDSYAVRDYDEVYTEYRVLKGIK